MQHKNRLFFHLIFFILFTPFTTCFTTELLSHSELWSHFTISNGLPTNQIRHLIEDQNGNLLVVTINDGIYLYNGLQFLPLPLNENLPTLFIQQVVKDRQNRLWIACNYAGIWIYDHGNLYPFKYNHLFEKEHFRALFIDRQDRVWINVNQVGLFVFDGGKCENITQKFNLLTEDVVKIEQKDSTSFYLLYQRSGLYKFSFSSQKKLNPVMDNKDSIAHFYLSCSGELWLARLQTGISVVKNYEEINILKSKQIAFQNFGGFLEDNQNRIWFCQNNSVYCYQDDILSSFSLENVDIGLPFQDRFFNIWFATNNGIYKFLNPEMKITSFFPSGEIKSKQNDYNRFLIKDRSGDIWFDTKSNQLFKYDGQNVKQLKLPDSLKHLQITSIAQDKEGEYWLGTIGDGIICWDGKSFVRKIPVKNLPGEYVTSIFIDSKNRVWIGSISELLHYINPKALRISPDYANRKNKFPNEIEVTSLHVTEDETVWLGTLSDQIWYSSDQKFKQAETIIDSRPGYQNIQNLFFETDKIWGNSQHGIFYFDVKQKNTHQFRNPSHAPRLINTTLSEKFHWISGDFFHSNSIYSLEKYSNYYRDPNSSIYNISSFCNDSSGGVWVGSFSVGLFYINEDTLIHFGSIAGLTSLKISTLYLDSQKRLWIGTLDRGLFRKQGQSFIQTPVMKNIGKSISTFFEDSREQLWVGTLDNGLIKYKDDSLQIYQQGLGVSSIWGIGESPAREIYVCLENANFAYLDGDKFLKLAREEILFNRNLRAAFKNKTINFRKSFLTSTRSISSGLVCWDGEKLNRFTIENGLPGHEITDIAETADGRLWVATLNAGIAVLEDNRFRKIGHPALNRLTRFFTLCTPLDSSLWALTQDEGMAYLKGDSVNVWGGNSKIAPNRIRGIQFDQNNNIILANANQLYYFNDGDLFKIPDLPVKENGNTIMPNFYVDQTNHFFLTTSDYKFINYHKRDIAPIINIKTCQIDNDLYSEVQLNEPVRRGYKDKACAIEFYGYHSSFPTQTIKYSYRIRKDDSPSEWGLFIEQNRIIFTQLEPGHNHIFEIRAKAPNGQISDKPARLQIILEKSPVYLQNWFQLIMLSLVLLSITFYFFYRYYKINRLMIRRKFNPYVAGGPIFKLDLFFGRNEILNQILTILHNNNIMITGERRIGKTSLLIQLKRQLAESNDSKFKFIPISIDLQGVAQWEFFYSIMQDIAGWGEKQLSGLRLRFFKKKSDYSYRDFNADFLKIIRHLTAEYKEEVKLVLLMDEADAMNEFDQVVHAQLRRLFMQDFSVNFAAIIAGTNYIQNWNRPESPWWNLFTMIELKALNKAEAKKLIREPVKGIFKFQSEAIETILQAANYKPYPIQTLCLHLINLAFDRKKRTIKKEDVVSLIEKNRFGF